MWPRKPSCPILRQPSSKDAAELRGENVSDHLDVNLNAMELRGDLLGHFAVSDINPQGVVTNSNPLNSIDVAIFFPRLFL